MERPRLQAWISPERNVANALQNMLASGRIGEAGEVADKAVGLLRGKYSDPTGAALGALILYKTGRLDRRINWVINLARDFKWLPDGAVLLACLLHESGGDRNRVIQLAVDASKRRPLFTESYSLLLDLLRRLQVSRPREIKENPRPQRTDSPTQEEALHGLARVAPRIDWDAVCLSYSRPDMN